MNQYRLKLMTMMSRRDAAQILDIPLEMAKRHGIPQRIAESELDAIRRDPPAWLLQSRANRTGKRPVWVTLRCHVCDRTETTRPKKWWPEFSFVICDEHRADEIPAQEHGMRRSQFDGVGDRFIGFLDEPFNG